ncbi:uncharacterized protein LOC123666778 [Melitaea cinxia]|uniref:uncharacterized protein LOC123666778 n=1 Tax=Melitaea cinxia TaxID=113334 RepID=UPI001E273129|nr:uncharacterized protein LOC123666778 [Melitaea cinxia]
MHTNYFRGASTIAKIVRTVCRAIWKHLSSQNIPPITKQVLEDVAIEFDKKANFPNCIGALDGDEAFSISNNVMRPYSGKHLSVQQRVYNYRLSRARRYVECAFGILANKWRIFHRSMNVQYEFATDIIKACCVMHNFVLNRDGVQATDDIIFDDSDLQMLHLTTANENNLSPHLIRNDFCNYFSSDVGALSWQLNKI